jgi:hypothetical protein
VASIQRAWLQVVVVGKKCGQHSKSDVCGQLITGGAGAKLFITGRNSRRRLGELMKWKHEGFGSMMVNDGSRASIFLQGAIISWQTD